MHHELFAFKRKMKNSQLDKEKRSSAKFPLLLLNAESLWKDLDLLWACSSESRSDKQTRKELSSLLFSLLASKRHKAHTQVQILDEKEHSLISEKSVSSKKLLTVRYCEWKFFITKLRKSEFHENWPNHHFYRHGFFPGSVCFASHFQILRSYVRRERKTATLHAIATKFLDKVKTCNGQVVTSYLGWLFSWFRGYAITLFSFLPFPPHFARRTWEQLTEMANFKFSLFGMESCKEENIGARVESSGHMRYALL